MSYESNDQYVGVEGKLKICGDVKCLNNTWQPFVQKY